MSRATAYASDTEAIDPERLYPLAVFIRASGLSKTRLYQLSKDGIELPKIWVGRRAFVRGRDGIALIEQIATS